MITLRDTGIIDRLRARRVRLDPAAIGHALDHRNERDAADLMVVALRGGQYVLRICGCGAGAFFEWLEDTPQAGIITEPFYAPLAGSNREIVEHTLVCALDDD